MIATRIFQSQVLPLLLLCALPATLVAAQEHEPRVQVIARSGGFPALEPRSSDYTPRRSRAESDPQPRSIGVHNAGGDGNTDQSASQDPFSVATSDPVSGGVEALDDLSRDVIPETPRAKMIAPLVTVGSSLAIVLALFCALVWAGRKFGGGAAASKPLSASVMTPLGHVMLDPRTKLMLVKCGRRILVLSQTAGGITPISEVTDPDEVRELIANCSSEAREVFQRTLREIELEPVRGFTDEPPRQATAGRPTGRLFATNA